MKISPFVISLSLALFWLLFPYPAALNGGVSVGNQEATPQQEGTSQKSAARRPSSPATTGTGDRDRELVEREASLNLKEQELKRISAKLDARMKELENTKKSIETTITSKKKVDNERYKKMLKLYKALRPEEAAGLIDKLDEDIAIELLNQMDTKTAAKLIPFLNQKRVLKWTHASLKDN